MASSDEAHDAAIDVTAITHSQESSQQILGTSAPKYGNILQTCKVKVESLKEWKERMVSENPPTVAFEKALTETLSYCSAAFSIIRDDRQFFDHAEQLALAIVEMRNHLGRNIMPLEKFHGFSRGTFETGGQTLCSAQYYEEIPFYGPPRQPHNEEGQITKIYEWKLINKPKAGITTGTPVKCVYYLEKGRLLGSCYYVLGMSAPGVHATIKTFHGEIPSFFMLEETIVRNLSAPDT